MTQAITFDENDAELEITSIDTVTDRNYDERVTVFAEITHPELKRVVVKFNAVRGCIQDGTDEIDVGVEYHVEPGKEFDLSSLVANAHLTFVPGTDMDDDQDLEEFVREVIEHWDTAAAVDDLDRESQGAPWSIRAVN